MPISLLKALILFCALTAAVLAQNEVAPNLNEMRANYKAAVAKIEEEHNATMAAGGAAYEAGLRALEAKLIAAKKLEDALLLRSEVDKVKEGKQLASLPRNAATDWRTMRTAYESHLQTATKVSAPKLRSARQSYLQKLAIAERSLSKEANPEAFAVIKSDRFFIGIATQLEQRAYVLTPDAPSNVEIPPHGAVLAGFKFGLGGFNGRTIIKCIQPVFLTADGELLGSVYGQGNLNQKVIAPPGYAVGGMLVKVGDRLDAFSLTFMKLKDGALELTPADVQQSDWFGNQKGPKPRQVAGNGKLVIGTAIRSGADVDNMGLVTLR